MDLSAMEENHPLPAFKSAWRQRAPGRQDSPPGRTGVGRCSSVANGTKNTACDPEVEGASHETSGKIDPNPIETHGVGGSSIKKKKKTGLE